MNWGTIWHLCWVLLVLNGVRAGEDGTSPRPTSLRLPKERRPLRHNNIGHNIKTGATEDFKSPQFQDIASSTTPLVGLSRFTSKTPNNVDYLARNTVPVAAFTETTRKLSRNRPPPAHLLAYQAFSTTEKVADSPLSPTGWALASLVPSKDATSQQTKKVNSPLTPKPLTNYWSTRLLRASPRRTTTPMTPIESQEEIEQTTKNRTELAVPINNVPANESTTNISSLPESPAQSSFILPENEPHFHKQKENDLKEFPSTPLKSENSTSPQTPSKVVNNIPNTGNNLIKELKSGDLSSSILNSIVIATAASKYAEQLKPDIGASESQESNSTLEKPESILLMGPDVRPTSGNHTIGDSISNRNASDEINTLRQFIPEVTKTPDQQETASSAMMTTLRILNKAFSTPSMDEIATENVTSTSPLSITLESDETTDQPNNLTVTTNASSISPVTTEKLANFLENFIAPTTPFENTTSHPKINTSLKSTQSSHYEPDAVTDLEKQPTFKNNSLKILLSTPSTTTFITETLTTTPPTSISEPKVVTLPHIVESTSNSDDQSSPKILATTPPQEVNDIPEALTRIKINANASSAFDKDLEKPRTFATSAPETTTEPKPSSANPNTSEITTKLQTPSATTPYTSGFLNSNITSQRPVEFDPITPMQSSEPSVTTAKYENVTHEIPENESSEMSTFSPNVSRTDATPTEQRTTPKTVISTSTEIVDTTTDYSPEYLKTTVSTTNLKTTPKPEYDEHTTPLPSKSNSSDVLHLFDKGESEDDDTLKYNVTSVDIPIDKSNNTTDQENDYNDKGSDEENDKDSELPASTISVIIEETTTSKPSTVRTTTNLPTTTTHDIQSTTTEMDNIEDPADHNPTTVTPEDVLSDPRLRLIFHSSFNEMCMVKDNLVDSIMTFFKDATSKPIHRRQIKLLNLGNSECSSKVRPFIDNVPVILQITDSEGKGDGGLTELLYSHLKQNQFNFKYQLTSVERGSNPVVMEEDNQWGGTVIAAIVISSVAGISLLCLTILLVIMRRRQKGFTYGQRCTPVSLEDYSLDNISVFNSVRRKAMRASKRSYGNPAFDDPVTVTNPLNFVELSNMANSHAKIDNEYSEVPTVTVKPDELPPGAEHKNRYANVIPIPETRVALTDSDREEIFINANYVKGAKGADKFYIACQAPLDSTIADFWMMVWEQQTQVILMLTDLHENGVEKCADYLPPSEVLDCHRVFGDLQVTLKKREVREKYIISSLQLRNLDSNLWREVIHLWYTGWPIRGVPDDLTSIIAYLIEARSYSKPGHPIIVHCSPGTGRTGTIIAIDVAIRDFETDRTVDIPKTVYSIRRDRAGSVQTNLQYYLIYQVIHLYATKLTGGGLDSI